jgi:flagellar protein FlaG
MKMITENLVNVVVAPIVTSNNDNTIATARKQSDNPVAQSQDQENVQVQQTEANSKEKLNKAIEVANSAFKEVDISFKYSFDQKLNLQVVELVNDKTGEKIRQYPPEEIVNMLSRMYDMLGILIDKKI